MQRLGVQLALLARQLLRRAYHERPHPVPQTRCIAAEEPVCGFAVVRVDTIDALDAAVTPSSTDRPCVTAVVQPALAAWHAGVDQPGGDLPGTPVPLYGPEGNRTAACFDLCEAMPACKAWAFAFAPLAASGAPGNASRLLRHHRDTAEADLDYVL